jgi:hypothetical protein
MNSPEQQPEHGEGKSLALILVMAFFLLACHGWFG